MNGKWKTWNAAEQLPHSVISGGFMMIDKFAIFTGQNGINRLNVMMYALYISVAFVSNNLSFFKKVFGGHKCPFLGPVISLFWFSGDVSSGVQSQRGFYLIHKGECNVHSPRFTSGATLADLLAAGAQPVTSPHACAEVGLDSDSNVQPHEQKTNALPLCQLNFKLFYFYNTVVNPNFHLIRSKSSGE